MRKTILILFAIFASAMARGQGVEEFFVDYWIDDDVANKVSVPYSESSPTLDFDIPTDGISSGFHKLSMQLRKSDGTLGSPSVSYFSNLNILIKQEETYTYKYRLDDGEFKSGTSSSATLDLDIDLESLSQGMHRFTMALLNSDGDMFTTVHQMFYKQDLKSTTTDYTYSYWIDDQPQVTKDLSEESLSFDLNMTALPMGMHRFSMMITDSNNDMFASVHNLVFNEGLSVSDSLTAYAMWVNDIASEPITVEPTTHIEHEFDIDLPVPAFPTQMSDEISVERYSNEGIASGEELPKDLRLAINNEYTLHYSYRLGEDTWVEDSLTVDADDYKYLAAPGITLNTVGQVKKAESPSITARSIEVADGALTVGVKGNNSVGVVVTSAKEDAERIVLSAEEITNGKLLEMPEAGTYYFLFDEIEGVAAGEHIRLTVVNDPLPSPLNVIEAGSLSELLTFADKDKMDRFELTGRLNAADFETMSSTLPALKELSLPSTLTEVPDGAFSGMGDHLLVLDWNSKDAPVNAAAFDAPEDMQNLIVYAPEGTNGTYEGNLVIGDAAKSIVLYDELPVRITKEFTAGNISYTRNFDLKSTRQGKAAGWESIVLPFTVQNIESAEKGQLTPFGSESGTKAAPFWLAQMTSSADVFELTSELKSNVPYIISMPNNADEYAERYNITGDVIFSAENAKVSKTTDASVASGQMFDLVPAYEPIAANESMYVVNRVAYGDYLAGGAFVKGLRDAVPFEAYARAKATLASLPEVLAIRGFANTTGIEKLYGDDVVNDGNQLKCYSENGILYVISAASSDIVVPLYSASGQLIRMVKLQPGTNTVDDLPVGLYYVGHNKTIVR